MRTLTKATLGLAAAGAAYVAVQRLRPVTSDETKPAASINGFVSSGFEPVREVFAENFLQRREVGAACCVYHKGKAVVDLWGGIRDIETGEPWQENTMALVYSTTKGMAAMTLAIAHSRGILDYDERVCKYWPEFAQNGKEEITVRQLLGHQAGLFAFDQPVDRHTVANLDRLAEVMARQKPVWEPGTRQGYHAITLGYYEGELLRRIDPQHRSLGQFFQDEIARPLGLDFYIGLPDAIPDSRLARLIDPALRDMLFGFPIRMGLEILSPHSRIRRSLAGSEYAHDDKHIYPRNLEIPSGGGVGTARAIARAYSVFATGGEELGLSEATLKQLSSPAVPPTRGFYDEVMKGEVQFSLGFMKSNPSFSFGSPSSYGHPGAGGSIGFADPDAQIGYAYIPNRKSVEFAGDPRDVALRRAVYSVISQ